MTKVYIRLKLCLQFTFELFDELEYVETTKIECDISVDVIFQWCGSELFVMYMYHRFIYCTLYMYNMYPPQ